MNSVYIIGAGGHSKQVIDAFLFSNICVVGVFDNFREGVFYRGLPILGKIDDVTRILPPNENIFITFGDNRLRRELAERFAGIYNFPNCIRKNSDIPFGTSIMGKGNYIGAFSKLGEDASIGDFNIINECTFIAHDTRIGSFNHLSPNASICGNVVIGDGNMIGVGSSVIPRVVIGNNCTVGAGSVVIRPVADGATVFGNPAKLK